MPVSSLPVARRDDHQSKAPLVLAGAVQLYGLVGVAAVWINDTVLGACLPPQWAMSSLGIPLIDGVWVAALVCRAFAG